MTEITEYIQQAAGSFWGESIYYVWFFIAAALIVLLGKSPVVKRVFGIYPIVFLLAVTYSSVAYSLVQKYTTGIWQYYARLFSMIPLSVILGLGSVLLIDAICSIRLKKKDVHHKRKDAPDQFSHWRAALKLLLTGGCCCTMIFGGISVYEQNWIQPAQNLEKVPADAIEICKILHRDEGVTIAVPGELPRYIRQIDASFYMPYSRYVNDLGNELSQTNPDPDYVMTEAGKEGCDYIVVFNNIENLSRFQLYAWEPYAVQGDYLIYEVKDVPRTVNTYNSDRQLSRQRKLDENDESVTAAFGYDSIGYEYDQRGDVQSECYYDETGKLVGKTGVGADRGDNLMRCYKFTDGVYKDRSGAVLFTTSVYNNWFSLIRFQIISADKSRFLLSFGDGKTTGEISGEYVHELPTGLYCLRMKANTNLADEYIDSLVYLQQGDRLAYRYTLEELDQYQIVIRDLSVYLQ